MMETTTLRDLIFKFCTKSQGDSIFSVLQAKQAKKTNAGNMLINLPVSFDTGILEDELDNYINSKRFIADLIDCFSFFLRKISKRETHRFLLVEQLSDTGEYILSPSQVVYYK